MAPITKFMKSGPFISIKAANKAFEEIKYVERERERKEKNLIFHSSNLYLQLRDIYIQG